MADTSTSSPQRRDSLSGVQPSRRDRSPWRIMDPVRGGIRFAMALAIGGSALSVLVFACVCWLFRDRLHLTGLGSLAKNRRG